MSALDADPDGLESAARALLALSCELGATGQAITGNAHQQLTAWQSPAAGQVGQTSQAVPPVVLTAAAALARAHGLLTRYAEAVRRAQLETARCLGRLQAGEHSARVARRAWLAEDAADRGRDPMAAWSSARTGLHRQVDRIATDLAVQEQACAAALRGPAGQLRAAAAPVRAAGAHRRAEAQRAAQRLAGRPAVWLQVSSTERSATSGAPLLPAAPRAGAGEQVADAWAAVADGSSSLAAGAADLGRASLDEVGSAAEAGVAGLAQVGSAVGDWVQEGAHDVAAFGNAVLHPTTFWKRIVDPAGVQGPGGPLPTR